GTISNKAIARVRSDLLASHARQVAKACISVIEGLCIRANVGANAPPVIGKARYARAKSEISWSSSSPARSSAGPGVRLQVSLSLDGRVILLRKLETAGKAPQCGKAPRHRAGVTATHGTAATLDVAKAKSRDNRTRRKALWQAAV